MHGMLSLHGSGHLPRLSTHVHMYQAAYSGLFYTSAADIGRYRAQGSILAMMLSIRGRGNALTFMELPGSNLCRPTMPAFPIQWTLVVYILAPFPS